MNIKPDYKPILTVGHYVTIWIFIGGLVMTGLSRGNEIEKQQVRTETRQKEIIKQQAEIKQDVKDARKGQREIRDLLIEIKTNQEK
jgi:hypothetical protein